MTNDSHQRSLWILLLGSGLNSFAIFLSIPLITLFAYNNYGLSAMEIGLLSGIWPATVFLLSAVCGLLADRWGYLLAIRVSGIINAAAFLMLAFAPDVAAFSAALFCFGVGKSFFDSTIRVAIACLCRSEEREKYFRIRYMLLNVGCVLGPVVGVFAYQVHESGAFLLTAAVYLAFFFACTMLLQAAQFPREVNQDDQTQGSRWRTLRDPRLLVWVLGFALILMAYGSYEAFMPIIIEQSNGSRPSFGILVSLNAAVVILFQYFHLRYLPWMTLGRSMVFGIILMCGGFLLLAVEQYPYSLSLVSVVVFSIGETLLFPCFEVLMDRLAPPRNKALYFGAGEVKQVGFFFGPVLGGLLFTAGGGVAILLGAALWVAMAGGALYLIHCLMKPGSCSSRRLSIEP